MYTEGNPDISPHHGIVDTACPKTVAGKKFLDSYVETNRDDLEPIKRTRENEKFKFGPSSVYKSDTSHKLRVQVGSLVDYIN